MPLVTSLGDVGWTIFSWDSIVTIQQTCPLNQPNFYFGWFNNQSLDRRHYRLIQCLCILCKICKKITKFVWTRPSAIICIYVRDTVFVSTVTCVYCRAHGCGQAACWKAVCVHRLTMSTAPGKDLSHLVPLCQVTPRDPWFMTQNRCPLKQQKNEGDALQKESSDHDARPRSTPAVIPLICCLFKISNAQTQTWALIYFSVVSASQMLMCGSFLAFRSQDYRFT